MDFRLCFDGATWVTSLLQCKVMPTNHIHSKQREFALCLISVRQFYEFGCILTCHFQKTSFQISTIPKNVEHFFLFKKMKKKVKKVVLNMQVLSYRVKKKMKKRGNLWYFDDTCVNAQANRIAQALINNVSLITRLVVLGLPRQTLHAVKLYDKWITTTVMKRSSFFFTSSGYT